MVAPDAGVLIQRGYGGVAVDVMALTRRNTIVGLGALAAGAGVIGGTGAFTAVEADREVSVEATGDDAALLAIAPNDETIGPSGGISSRDGSELVAYPGDTSHYVTAGGDSGVAALEFDDEEDVAANLNARTRFDDLLVIQNNGTQDVGIYVEDHEQTDGQGNPTVDFLAYDGEGPASVVGDEDDAITLGAGNHAGVTVAINLWDVTDTDDVDFPEEVRIVADANLA